MAGFSAAVIATAMRALKSVLQVTASRCCMFPCVQHAALWCSCARVDRCLIARACYGAGHVADGCQREDGLAQPAQVPCSEGGSRDHADSKPSCTHSLLSCPATHLACVARADGWRRLLPSASYLQCWYSNQLSSGAADSYIRIATPALTMIG